MKQDFRFHTIRTVLAVVLALFSAAVAGAQGRFTVTGKVSDASGKPMVGVTIIEQGTTNGTTTGLDGTYSLVVKDDRSVLQFSSLGYTSQSVTVGSKNEIDVSLSEDAINMSEVVVTGYGRTVTKDKLTAAISKVSSDVLEKGVRSNALTALAGTVTGVRIASTTGQPGAAPSIVIRGGAALDGTGSPLYVIDGVQREDMNDINANDIESIEILKDAAATALYGARANAGVVLVTTKRGRVGRAEISFKANVGLNYLRKTNEFLEADDYLYYLRLASYRSGNIAALSAAGPFGTGNVLSADGNKSAEGVYSPMFLSDENAYLLKQGYKSMIDPITGKTIIYSEFTASDASVRDLALTQDYNISASGGNDRGRYYASLGYYDESGFPVISYYKRLSFVTNGSYKITPWLESTSSLNFSRSDSRQVSDYIGGGEANFFGIMFSAPPTMRHYNPDGEEIIPTTNWENGNWDVAKSSFYRRNTNYRFTMNQGLNFRLTDHITLKLNGMWYFNMYEKEKFNGTYLVNPGTSNSDHAASASYSRMLSQTYNAIAGYENSWNDHNLSVIVGYEFYDKYNFGLSAGGQGSDFDDLPSLGYIDKTEDKNISKISMNSTHTRERSMSFFGNASYDWKGKYLFSFSARYDGYSKLVNNKWGFFPGVSAAWNIHKEKFMEGTSRWLSSLKLRAGYGQNGNVNILAGAYDLQGNYGKTGNYEDEYGILINKLPYPDLRWEKTTSVDVAVEASFWNRLRVSVGAYNKLTSDLLAEVPFPSSAGVGNQYTNNGSVRNRGLEFEIDATVFQNDDWKVRFGGNATYMRSKIIQLPDNGNLNNRQGGQQVYNAAGDLIWVGGKQEGQEYGVAYAYRMIDIVRSEADLQNFAWYVDTTPSSGTIYGPGVWATLTADEQAKGQLLQPGDAIFYDVNGDNTIDQYDQVKMGNTVPRWVGGVNLSVDWKGLSLYARFDFATGYVAQNSRKQYYMALSQGTFNTLKESKDTWSEERPNAKYPILMYADTKFRNNYRMSNIFYDDSSYLCAREIALSYSLPERWARVVRMKNLTVSVTGQNLFYWTGSSLYNPEYGVNGNGGYAIPRTVLFGIKATF